MLPTFTRAEIIRVIGEVMKECENDKDAYYNYVLTGFGAKLGLQFFKEEDKKQKEVILKTGEF